MNREEFDRWVDFAMRMAISIYGDHRRPSGVWILQKVRHFLESMEDEYEEITSWDGGPIYVCDRMSDFIFDDLKPSLRWRIKERLDRQAESLLERLSRERGLDVREQRWDSEPENASAAWREISDLESALQVEIETVLEKLEPIADEQWEDQFAGPIRCCIRAGLDLASEPSAGVVGFTVGDLRAMYPEGIPDWVEAYVSGVPLAPLSEVADHVGVWL